MDSDARALLAGCLRVRENSLRAIASTKRAIWHTRAIVDRSPVFERHSPAGPAAPEAPSTSNDLLAVASGLRERARDIARQAHDLRVGGALIRRRITDARTALAAAEEKQRALRAAAARIAG